MHDTLRPNLYEMTYRHRDNFILPYSYHKVPILKNGEMLICMELLISG